MEMSGEQPPAPVTPPAATRPPGPTSPDPACTPPVNPKRILLVDDDPAVTRSLKLNLECTLRYDVRTENDARCVLPAVRQFHPDLILLDVVMPGMDGCEVAARIHTDQELKDTPIVFLTALATNEDTGGRTTVAGSTVYFAKPVMLDELIRCIEAYARK